MFVTVVVTFLLMQAKPFFRNIAGIDLTVVHETALDAWHVYNKVVKNTAPSPTLSAISSMFASDP